MERSSKKEVAKTTTFPAFICNSFTPAYTDFSLPSTDISQWPKPGQKTCLLSSPHRILWGNVPIQETLSKTDRLSSTEGSSLSDQVYDYLADQIITGKISFGDRLNIKQIAAQLNVSTIPIRDAIKRLEQEKVVVVMPRSHCYVRIPTKKATLDAIDSRRMIELFAINAVVESTTAKDLQQLDAVVESMRPLAAESHIEEHPRSVSEYIELDRKFHTTLVGLSQNEYIMEFYKQVNMHLSMSFSYGIGVCHGIASTFAEHEAILDHLHHNRREAAEVLENHLLKSRENILREARFQSLSE